MWTFAEEPYRAVLDSEVLGQRWGQVLAGVDRRVVTQFQHDAQCRHCCYTQIVTGYLLCRCEP